MKANNLRRTVWLLALVIAPLLAFAANSLINVDDTGIVIHGYDPVAYFTAGKPTPGKVELAYSWSGATWLFASEENRQAFIDNPKHFAPQFGGFCACAASYGEFADVDPQAWTILNDRLYLSYNLRVREIWRPRAAEFNGDAETLWPDIKRP